MKNLQLSDPMSAAEAEGRKTVTRRVGERCRYVVGDPVYFGEALVPVIVLAGRVASYRRDGELVLMRRPDGLWGMEPWEWKTNIIAPRYCPQRCARRFGLITSVRRERLCDMTHGEAVLEGFADRDEFRALWEKLHGEPPDWWHDMVWRIEWRSVSCEEAERVEMERKRR